MKFPGLRLRCTAWLFSIFTCLAFQFPVYGSEIAPPQQKQAGEPPSSAQPSTRPKAINQSPTFDKPDGWSGGYALAIGHGPGVVVGPGTNNPNVFAQPFLTEEDRQFRVIARASSFERNEAVGAIQINWSDKNGKFITTTQKPFKVTPVGKTFHHIVASPREATQGMLYVVPGGSKDAVRYTEMTLSRLDPINDFMVYSFYGIQGPILMLSGAFILLIATLHVFCKKHLHRATAIAGNNVSRLFPPLALILCGGMFIFMEGNYEQHYDSAWHQSLVENVIIWKDISLSLGGNILNNFGIQHPMNPWLSPTFLIGSIVNPDHRIQVQAAFQAMVIFALLTQMCRFAGARLTESSAISLIASGYLWIPDLSDQAITLNATLGLLWQEGTIATLVAFFCFARIGYGKIGKSVQLWPIFGLVAAILWFSLAYPLMIAFFTLATVGLCLGALASVACKRELLYKFFISVSLIAVLLAIGFHHYVLNLFLYTPQMYFKTLYTQDFSALFFSNTSLLLASGRLGDAKVIAFFIFAAIGAVVALRFGNPFTRRLVFGGLALEVTIHALSGLNVLFKVVPLTFTYVEQMGLPVVALLAGTGIWAVLRMCSMAIARGGSWVAHRMAAS